MLCDGAEKRGVFVCWSCCGQGPVSEGEERGLAGLGFCGEGGSEGRSGVGEMVLCNM
jgi:hypothetical protein